MEHHQIVLCEGIIEEIEEKLRGKIKVPTSVIAEFIGILRRNSQIYKPKTVKKETCRDPDDLKILGLVVPAKADAIITGDKDLLELKKYKNTPILSPRDFWEMNKKRG